MALWFRFYSEALDDPKVQSLPPDAFKAWVNLLCIASKTSGALPPIDQIAFHLRCDNETATAFHEELAKRGLIDVGARGSRIHSWDKRQYKSDTSTERVKRFRKREESVSVTPPEPYTEPDTDTDKKEVILSPQAAPKPKNGSRLPDDWALPKAWGNWALENVAGATVETVRSQADQFRDYWVGKAGAGARKADWEATWRNWMRNAKVTARGSPPQPNGKPRNIAEASARLVAQMKESTNANSQPRALSDRAEQDVPYLAAPNGQR
jgi:hypothetical protein